MTKRISQIELNKRLLEYRRKNRKGSANHKLLLKKMKLAKKKAEKEQDKFIEDITK